MADRKRVKIPIKTYLVYLILVTFLVTGVTFSRFITNVTGGDSATVAKPLIEFTLADDIGTSVYTLAPISMKPGDEISYTMKVANGDAASTVTEVALSYTISVTVYYKTNPHLNPVLPITAAVYLSDNPATTGVDESQFLADESYTFGVGPVQEDHFYILTLLWNSGDNNYANYEGDEYSVVITVDWQQKVS